MEIQRTEIPLDSQLVSLYDNLKSFHKIGNLDPKLNYIDESGKRVGRWVYKQRVDRKKGRLSKDKIERLDKLKINWLTPSERK